MAFPVHVKDSLHARAGQVPLEFANGAALKDVLARDLSAVEAVAGSDLLTSILLLEGRHLRHAAGPRLPLAYRAAIDGVEIGPCVGSCGTAAFFARPIYVTDIANDPLWADYRELALSHGLRACWSTPIFDDEGAVIGTFAIYHLTPRSPTSGELEAIRAITAHVARAITWSASLDRNHGAQGNVSGPRPTLRIVAADGTIQNASRTSGKQQGINGPAPHGSAVARSHGWLWIIVKNIDEVSRRIDRAIDEFSRDGPESAELTRLRRAKEATLKAATLARDALSRNANQ